MIVLINILKVHGMLSIIKSPTEPNDVTESSTNQNTEVLGMLRIESVPGNQTMS